MCCMQAVTGRAVEVQNKGNFLHYLHYLQSVLARVRGEPAGEAPDVGPEQARDDVDTMEMAQLDTEHEGSLHQLMARSTEAEARNHQVEAEAWPGMNLRQKRKKLRHLRQFIAERPTWEALEGFLARTKDHDEQAAPIPGSHACP